MGGKTWSAEEERYFWEVVVPQSQQAVRPNERLHSWETLAIMMQEAMGEPRRREYTRTMLYEHYYQNIKTGSHSPKAKEYVRKHKAALKAEAEKEQSDVAAAAIPSPHAGPSSTPTATCKEPRALSAVSREALASQNAPVQESFVRDLPVRTVLHREAPQAALPRESQLPPLSYLRPGSTRYNMPASPFPPQRSGHRIPSPHGTSASAIAEALRGLKRRHEDIENDPALAKRRQLPTLEPTLRPHPQFFMDPSAHIRQASEDWLRQSYPMARPYAFPPPYPSLPSPEADPHPVMTVDPVRIAFGRSAAVMGGRVVAPPHGMSRLDTLLWATRVETSAEDKDVTSSEATSASQPASATATNTPDCPKSENGASGDSGESDEASTDEDDVETDSE